MESHFSKASSNYFHNVTGDEGTSFFTPLSFEAKTSQVQCQDGD